MAKRSFTITAPDGKKTTVYKRNFKSKKAATSFADRCGKRVYMFAWNPQLTACIVSYFRDTRRNREMFGFEEHTPIIRIKK